MNWKIRSRTAEGRVRKGMNQKIPEMSELGNLEAADTFRSGEDRKGMRMRELCLFFLKFILFSCS